MRENRLAICACLWLFVGVACLGPQDNPTHVYDLRVLGASLEPPERMAPTCDWNALLAGAPAFASPVQYTALIADPAGQGRPLHYQLFACASADDTVCANAGDRQLLAESDAAPTAGQDWLELILTLQPGASVDANGVPMLQRVFVDDAYKGLDGLRLPLVLHLSAGTEEIWAQKLMVFSCAYFPDSAPNQTPHLPGVTLDGTVWDADELAVAAGVGPFSMDAVDFSGLQETYVVPALNLSPVHLKESWEISWYAEAGTFSIATTGGTDLAGQLGRTASQWSPDLGQAAGDVRMWFVVRDGRGGESWVARRLHYLP